jgi:hypothetical protein
LSTDLDESTTAVRYLLGELSEEEQKSFEASFIADDQIFENLQISEAEVIDAYVANELSARQRKHLEQWLAASPRLQERVAFARTLAQSIAAGKLVQRREGHDEPPFEPWWKRVFAVPLVGNLTPAGAFAALLIVIALGAVVVQTVRLRNESRRLEAERAELARQRDELARLAVAERDRTNADLREAQQHYERAEELVRSLQQQKAQQQPKQPSIFASLSLLPGSTRSGGNENVLEIPPAATEVRLALVLLRADYGSYQVKFNGPTSISRERVRPTRGKTLALRLPANLFRPGQYSVQVSGVTSNGTVEPVSDYVFRVTQK